MFGTSHLSDIPNPKIKEDKGQFHGSCNLTACQGPGAVCFNIHTYAYYCLNCARLINSANNSKFVVTIENPQHPKHTEYLDKDEYKLAINSDVINPYLRRSAEYFVFRSIRFFRGDHAVP